MYRLKKFALAAAAASWLMAVVGAGPASAANWDPANTTLTAHGTLILHVLPAGTVSCIYHSGVRSAGGADAFTTETGGTTPAPPTIGGCTTTFAGFTGLSIVGDAPWTLTATSTTAVDVTNIDETLTFMSQFGSCLVTAENGSIGASWNQAAWNQAASSLTPATTPIPVTHSGTFCPDFTTVTLTGSVVVPGLSIT